MEKILIDLAKAIRPAMVALKRPAGGRRPATKAICEALSHSRPVIEAWRQGPMIRRYSGCPEGPAKSYRKSGREFRVLEYLWDFSISRYAIPQAIEDPRAKPIGRGRFELVFVAESELGTTNEICRDLLKLLEARTSVRCLVYRRPPRPKDASALETRIVRVLHNHAFFAKSPGLWLFVGLTWGQQDGVTCTVSTLSVDLKALIDVPTA